MIKGNEALLGLPICQLRGLLKRFLEIAGSPLNGANGISSLCYYLVQNATIIVLRYQFR